MQATNEGPLIFPQDVKSNEKETIWKMILIGLIKEQLAQYPGTRMGSGSGLGFGGLQVGVNFTKDGDDGESCLFAHSSPFCIVYGDSISAMQNLRDEFQVLQFRT